MAAVSAGPGAIQPGVTRVGFLGTGVMGAPMAGHLLRAGYTVTVHTRNKAKAETLLEQGAAWGASPAEVAASSDVLCLMLGFPADVKQVTDAVLPVLRPGAVLIDFTSSAPALARDISGVAASRGCFSLDAPVTGGDVGAREARLAILCGGEPAVFDAVQPLLQLLGTPHLLGGPGAGQSAKLANQIAIATCMVGLCESLLFAHSSGLDVDAWLTAVRGGAAGSRSMELYVPRLRVRDFAPGFYVKHFVKDLGMCIEECSRMRLSLPGLQLAHSLYVAVSAQQHGTGGELGTQALLLALESLNAGKVVPARAV
jgi:3-hydroxyisobutyrate dehydrogenase